MTRKSSISRRESAWRGIRRQRPHVDPQRLQHGLPAASRTVDFGRAGAAAGRDAGGHPAVERIGTQILYDIPVPYNPEFGRGLNEFGGVQSRPGEPPIRITGFVVNPTIKTQYTESWFLNGQRRLGEHWIVEVGYVGTQGVNLERIDDVNRFAGDLLDGNEDRISRTSARCCS